MPLLIENFATNGYNEVIVVLNYYLKNLFANIDSFTFFALIAKTVLKSENLHNLHYYTITIFMVCFN